MKSSTLLVIHFEGINNEDYFYYESQSLNSRCKLYLKDKFTL